MPIKTKRLGAALGTCFATALFLGGCGSADNLNSQTTASSVTAEQACASLQGATVSGASVTDTTIVPAAGTNPLYCRIKATLPPQLVIQIDLPEAWNGKMLYEGGGGYDGLIQDVIYSGSGVLNAGYAIVQSNGGHIGTSAIDASFVSDPSLAYLFGSGSVPTSTGIARAMLQQVYKMEPSRSYYEGCSNGGREGLMAAQRNPNLFNGIIARAPVYNWTAANGAFHKNVSAISASGAAMNAEKVALLAKAVRDACDANDGVVDGIVSNPSACHFDPTTLRCPSGTDSGNSCLSDAQLNVVNTWTSGSSFANGTYTYPGWALTGNEDDPTAPFAAGGWATWLTGASGNGSDGLQYLFQNATIQAYLAKSSTVNSLTYTYDSNTANLAAMSALNDATNADLRPFMNNGGKLILWHGGNDPALNNRATTAYYEAVKDVVGGQAILDNFVRYYQAPGVDHCVGGPGADTVNLVDKLDKWVTQGTDPGEPIASKLNSDGSVALTRPLCKYPQYPRYTGTAGDANAAKLAQNFTCVSP